MYSEGHVYNTIVDRLNLLDYKTKIGRSFGKSNISEILRNEKYIGTFIFNTAPKSFNCKRNSHRAKRPEEIIKIDNGLPAIISKDVFDKV